MARKFLYVFAFLIFLVIAAALSFRLYGDRLMRLALVPSTPFETQSAIGKQRYASVDMWLARPDKPGNPALWTPAGYKPTAKPLAAMFFIHPTSYLDRAQWNAPLDDQVANDRAALFLRGQASAFNGSAEIWAPRYRQATFGAFLTSQAESEKALKLAYGDVRTAFDEFLDEIGPDRPIILAGHSQGALHLIRLLQERVAGKPLAKRIAAAYVVGWPVSRRADLPVLGMPECTTAAGAGCILSWQSFAEPADPSQVLNIYDATTGLNGTARKGTAMICTNPITGTPDAQAPATANLGTLVPSADMATATIVAKGLPARCAGRGFLLIGPPPTKIGQYVLPGNNYHVFDYSLFWANVRVDAARRLATFTTK